MVPSCCTRSITPDKLRRGRSGPRFSDVGAFEAERCGQPLPDCEVIVFDARRHRERRASLAGEVRQVEAQHREEVRPATLEALHLIVPIVGGRIQRVDHADDRLAAGAAGDGDFRRNRRRARAPLVFDVAEAMRWFPHRDRSGRGPVGAELEAKGAAHPFVDGRAGEPGFIARPGRHRLPHLFRRAGREELHLHPALALSVLPDWHDESPQRLASSGAG